MTRSSVSADPIVDVAVFPERTESAPESSPRALVRGSLIQAERILHKAASDPATLLQSLLFPALMVLLFWVVLDQPVSAHSGESNTFRMVPMFALIGAMAGASISGLGLRRERQSGLLTRTWVLPVHRASAMLGRLLSEAVRIVVTVSAVLLVGACIGFRITTGVPGALAILVIALGFGLAFSVMITALALLRPESRIVEWTAVGTNLAMFFNTGFVPVDAYPGWLQPIVHYQPLSCAVDAVRTVATGGAALTPILLTAAWSAALLVAFGGPAVAGYRRAATTR